MSDSEMLSVPSGGVDGMTNGISNGISNDTSEHKEHKEHKHKHKDKDRDREKDRHRDKDRHKSSHKDKDRDKDRDKERERSSHKSSHKDKEHKDRDDKHRDRDKDKEKHRDSDRDKHKHRESSDKDKERRREKEKDRERSDKDKHRDKDKSRDKERSDKDKSKHRDEKRHSSSNEERKDRDKDRHSSSHKSSHKDKHRDKDRDKDRHRDKDRNHEREKVKEIKEDPTEMEVQMEAPPPMEDAIVKEEPVEFTVKEEPVESEEEDKLVINEPVKEEPQEEEEEEDDIPLSARKRMRQEVEDDDEDDKPLSFRIKGKKPEAKEKKRKKIKDEDDDDEDFKPEVGIVKKEKDHMLAVKWKNCHSFSSQIMQEKKKVKKEKEKKPKKPKATKMIASPVKSESPTKKPKKEEEPVWRWWEETKRDDDLKWTFLEHRGPKMADPYERTPSHVKLIYDGQPLDLSETTEEVAGFYARMLDHDYTTKEVFNTNFFRDWRKSMTSKEKEIITDLKKCDFRKLHAYYVQKNEERKNRTKEEKKALKELNEEIVKEYGWCTIDGHRQRIGNFKVEPPGLFRGRGEHPKQGMVKRRTMPEDIIINCSKDSVIPKPPEGHKWKEVRFDPKVTWLACWVENIQGQTKYVMLNAASKLKGEKDWQKYETARRLHQIVDKIREQYRLDFKSKEMKIRQRAVALYFIDKLALRAGNEKDEDQADTVGCCSLRVEHITLHEEKDGKEYVVAFDFLGKDSIRYFNEVAVEKRVFKNLQLFMENKQDGDDLFDRLNTQILNKHLNELMEGLTAKVFRTYNASRTLQEQLEGMTNPDDPIPAKILSYNRANRAVAILCNHQRAAPKTFDKSMATLQKKIDDKREIVEEAERELKRLKKQAKSGGTQKDRILYEKKKKAVERLREQLEKLEMSATDKEENKTIALGTSKLNYLDPRISVAWCKKFDVPIEKIFNKTHRAKFQWAIDMATAEYNFMGEPMDISRTANDDDGEEEEED
ncbi:DNA topoisomerase I, mitochondrial isoform X2 [Palaemon carinicauda]|uniref:DNA topoisomerase I, mitochondrial isoform X2 n=1 Tax=Palaemon carinicauda TaxID=392227 RepID=UPI0035B684C5